MTASPSRRPVARPASETNIDEKLVSAAEQGDMRRVRELLEQGANLDYKTKDGVTALLWAASAGNHELVRLLLNEHANLDDRDSLGHTALMLAVMDPLVKDRKQYRTDSTKLDAQLTVETLLAYGADPLIKDANGDTALSHAKRGGAKGLLGQRAPQGPAERRKRSQLDGIIISLQNAEAKEISKSPN